MLVQIIDISFKKTRIYLKLLTIKNTYLSHIFIFVLFSSLRLKCVEIVVTGVDEAGQMVGDYELTLASQETLTADIDALRHLQEELVVSMIHTTPGGCCWNHKYNNKA